MKPGQLNEEQDRQVSLYAIDHGCTWMQAFKALHGDTLQRWS